MTLKAEIDKVRHLIADGDCEGAIVLLLSIPPGKVSAFHDELVLLHNRLSMLDKSVLEGTIAREDENIERNTITKALLSLIKKIEATETGDVILSNSSDQPPREHPEPSAPQVVSYKVPSDRLKQVFWVALLPIVALLAWAISYVIPVSTEKKGEQLMPEFTARIIFRPEDIQIRQTGLARINVGNARSEALPIPSNGIIHFRNIPLPTEERPLRLELSDIKYDCQITGLQASATEDPELDAAFYVDLEMQTFSGKVMHSNRQPASGILINIENGLAQTETTSDGGFTLRLPKWESDAVRLVLRKNGRVLIDRRVGLDSRVFQEIIIQD